MLASCGVVGLAAFAFHLVQFARTALRKGITAERLFSVAVVCVILATNLLDVHLFLPTVAVVYSVFLLFTELAPVSGAPAEGSARPEAEKEAEAPVPPVGGATAEESKTTDAE